MVGADLPRRLVLQAVRAEDRLGPQVCGKPCYLLSDTLVALQRRRLAAGVAFQKGKGRPSPDNGVGACLPFRRFFGGRHPVVPAPRVLAGVVLEAVVGGGDTRGFACRLHAEDFVRVIYT